MHKCLSCGKEFEGKFCPECGMKWVDPNTCPKCGTPHYEGAKFCTECGARLDGKVACSKCGALMEENASFCAECGAKIGGAKGVVGAQSAEVAQEKPGKVSSVFGLVGTLLIVASALMGLVFTFVIGVSASIDGKITETSMLYEYFGKAYKDLGSVRDSIKELFDFNKIGEVRDFAIYFPVVLGTVISALGIIGVVTLSAVTGYKAYKKYRNKQDANVVAPAAGTYLSFVATATGLLAINAIKYDENKLIFSLPTLAGFILGGILLGLGVVSLIVSNYKSFKGFNALARLICTLIASAFIVVVLALVSLPAIGVFEEEYSTGGSLSLFNGMKGMLLMLKSDAAITKVVAFSTVGTAALIALLAVSAVLICKNVSGISKGKMKNGLALCIVIAVLAAVYLVFTILTKNAMMDGYTDSLIDALIESYVSWYGGSEEAARAALGARIAEVVSSVEAETQFRFGVPITTVVFAALATVSEICGTVMNKFSKPAVVTE